MACCSRCGGTGVEPGPVQADATEKIESLRAECVARGTWVSPDGYVREAGAADLIGWSTKTMRNRRYSDSPIPHITRQGRPLYALTDIAEWMINTRK